MTLEQLSNLQVGQRVSRTTATEVRFGTITKIYNGNYQTQVLFDHHRDPMAYGYKDLELVPNNENFKNTNTMKKNNLGKIRTNGEKKEFLNFIEKVKKEMILAGVYHKRAKFNCFSDGIFSYSYSDQFCLFTFDIICEDTLFDKMKIKDLLEVKKIGYFDSGIYDKKTKEKLGGITYSIFD